MSACHRGLRGLAVMDAMQKLPVVPAGRRWSTLPAKVIVHSKTGIRFCSVPLDGW